MVFFLIWCCVLGLIVCMCVCVWWIIQLLYMTRYVSFNMDMYGLCLLCVGGWHSSGVCHSICVSFKGCVWIGDRGSWMGVRCVLWLCVGWSFAFWASTSFSIRTFLSATVPVNCCSGSGTCGHEHRWTCTPNLLLHGRSQWRHLASLSHA